MKNKSEANLEERFHPAISANDRRHAALQLLTLLSLMSSFCVESRDFNHFLWLLEIGSIEACYTLVHLILKKKLPLRQICFGVNLYNLQ